MPTFRPCRWVGAGLLGVLTLFAVGPASAHGLGAECKLKGNRVEVETYYDDDTPAANARVSVLNAEGKTVAEGRTDARGRWDFAAPPAGTYRVTVDAGAGHRARLPLTIPDGPKQETPAPSTARECPCHTDDAEDAVQVSDGPSRDEFTRTPWLKIGLGLALIGGLGLAWWTARRATAV